MLVRTIGLNQDAMSTYLPPMRRIVQDGNRDFELRLGVECAAEHRYIFGYIGLIQRLIGKPSQNTRTGFLAHVITKITWIDTGNYSTGPVRKCCFARVLAYTSNFTHREYAQECTISIRDLVQGYVQQPHTRGHTGRNLQFWRFSDATE